MLWPHCLEENKMSKQRTAFPSQTKNLRMRIKIQGAIIKKMRKRRKSLSKQIRDIENATDRRIKRIISRFKGQGDKGIKIEREGGR